MRPQYLPLGRLLSGFFGGLSGMQRALRSAFLARAGLSEEVFVATAVVVASLIDISRLGVYSRALADEAARIDYWLLGGAVLSTFGGAVLGNRFPEAMTMHGIRWIVAAMLLVVAAGLAVGKLSDGQPGNESPLAKPPDISPGTAAGAGARKLLGQTG